VLIVFTTLLWTATAIKGSQLLRAPDDRLLRTVAGGLAAASVAFTVGRWPVRVWLDSAVVGLPSLLRNIGMIAAFYSILAFFVYSTTRQNLGVKKLHRHSVVVGTFLMLAIVTWSTAPDHVRADPRAAAREGLIQGALFQLLAVTALIYSIVGALRHSAYFARRAQRKHLRIGLRVLVSGLAGALLADLISLAVTLMGLVLSRENTVLSIAETVYMAAILVAIPGLTVGLSYPIITGMVAAAPVWWRHWREYHALYPLWREVHLAFPDLTLRRSIGIVRPWSIHARRYRRACEIRDGLVNLAPYYPAREPRLTIATAHTYAEYLQEALRARSEARADGSEPIGGPVSTPIPRGFSGELDTDIRWLVDLTRAFGRVQVPG
jgi:hypothetical protein